MKDLVRIKSYIIFQKANCHGQLPCRLSGGPAPGRWISSYLPASGFRTTLTRIPPYCLFFVASSLSPHWVCFIAHPVGRPHFCLRGSVGLAVGLAIKWPTALPSSAKEPRGRRLSYYRSSQRRLSHRWSGLLESDHCESSYHRSTHCRSTHCGLSHQRCNVNKRQGHFRRKKNGRLIISKKPPNPVGTEEENQGRKDLIVVQFSKINFCDQWYIELFAKSGLHLGDLTRLCLVKPSLPATTFLLHRKFL